MITEIYCMIAVENFLLLDYRLKKTGAKGVTSTDDSLTKSTITRMAKMANKFIGVGLHASFIILLSTPQSAESLLPDFCTSSRGPPNIQLGYFCA